MTTVPRWRAPVLVAASVVLLLAVVASVGASRGGGPGGAGAGAVPAWVEYCALVGGGAIGTFALAFSLATHWRGRRRRLVYTPSPWWHKLLVWLVAMMWVAGAVVASAALARVAKEFGALLAHARGPSDLAGNQSLASGAALLGGLVIALAVMTGGAIGWRARPQPLRSPPAGPTPAAAQGRTFPARLSLDALGSEPDPRRAVIGAYAHMELCLAGAGLAREPYEAPFEHIDRVEHGLGLAVGHGRTLAGLFEWARFAHHPCGVEMKHSALSALRVVQEHLQPTPPGGSLQA